MWYGTFWYGMEWYTLARIGPTHRALGPPSLPPSFFLPPTHMPVVHTCLNKVRKCGIVPLLTIMVGWQSRHGTVNTLYDKVGERKILPFKHLPHTLLCKGL